MAQVLMNNPLLFVVCAASILSSCLQLTQAQSGSPQDATIALKPPNPIEGQNVTLIPEGDLKNVVSCNWYRGRTSDLEKRILAYYLPPNTLGQINGPAYTGRETGGPDCSLHIRNLTLADSGSYTLTKEGLVSVVQHADIKVSGPIPKPTPGPASQGTRKTSLSLTTSLAVMLLLPGMPLCLFSL